MSLVSVCCLMCYLLMISVEWIISWLVVLWLLMIMLLMMCVVCVDGCCD